MWGTNNDLTENESDEHYCSRVAGAVAFVNENVREGLEKLSKHFPKRMRLLIEANGDMLRY